MSSANPPSANATSWRVTLTLRSGAGDRGAGWLWGARLEQDAQKALAQWLLELQIREYRHWGLSAKNMEADRAEWTKKAARAHLEPDFESALGWARTAIWGLAREMSQAYGRNGLAFASGACAPNGPFQASEPLSALEIGFFGSTSAAEDPKAAQQLMLKAFSPWARTLGQAGPAAKRATFWMPRLAEVRGAVTAPKSAALMEREELLTGVRQGVSALNGQACGEASLDEGRSAPAPMSPKRL